MFDPELTSFKFCKGEEVCFYFLVDQIIINHPCFSIIQSDLLGLDKIVWIIEGLDNKKYEY